MTQPNVPGDGAVQSNLQLTGGAALVAPAAAFQGVVPPNALIVVPMTQPSPELTEALEKGAVAVTPERLWKLLGFNGPAVQVQDAQGRPIAIGLEDLLAGLDKHWQENKDDINRGRVYAQELLKYGRAEQAEKVLARVVAAGGTGDDWLGLGIAQIQQEKWEKAESTLKGAQNLLKDNPFPSLHLARVYQGLGNDAAELDAVKRAIVIGPGCVDAWAYLFTRTTETSGEEAALALVVELADAEPNRKTAAPFVAVQGAFAGNAETLDKALEWAEKAVQRNGDDPLALVCLSSLYGQKGDLAKVIQTLQAHEGKMARDVRLANNYFEALFRSGRVDHVTKLLNALAGSPDRGVKQFAIERSRMVAQFLQQQQQKLAGAANAAAGGGAPGNVVLS